MGQLLLISDVFPETRYWKVKVTVIEKSEPIENPGKATRQRLVLSDSKNNKVQAAIFAENIELFKDDFELHKTYFISDAIVRDVIQRYRISTYPYQWTITGKSSVELCEEESSNIEVSLVNYTPFSEFEPIVGSNADVDVIAIVIHILPRRCKSIRPEKETIIQEFIVIEKSEIPTLLTLWDQYAIEEGSRIVDIGADNVPVIVGTRLRVSDYRGVSLSTKSGSILTVNPSTTAAEELRRWAIGKLPHLRELASKFLEIPIQQQTIQLSPSQPTTPLSEAKKKAQSERFFWTKATLLIEDFNQPFQYTGCKKCKRATGVRVNISFRCSKCQTKSDSIANARVNVVLKDESGQVPAQMFGELAEKVFGFSADDFAVQQENSQENHSKHEESSSHVARKLNFSDNITEVVSEPAYPVQPSYCRYSLFDNPKQKDTNPGQEEIKTATKSIPCNALSESTLQLIEARQIKKEKIEQNENELKQMQKINPKKARKK